MGIISWIILGLIAGAVAKVIMPGKDPGGLVITIGLGIVGAVLGGFIGARLGMGTVRGLDVRSLAIAVGGALLLLWGYRLAARRR